MLLDENYNTPDNIITFQNVKGHDAIIAEMMNMAEKKLNKLNERRARFTSSF